MATGYGGGESYGHQESHGYGKDSYEPHVSTSLPQLKLSHWLTCPQCSLVSPWQYSPQPYKFGYDVKDGYGGNLNQKEEGDSYGNKKGSYGYTDPYGIYRHVEYYADKTGFHASIKTNEPGTAAQNPADVYMDASPVHTNYEPAPYKAASAPKAYKAPSGYSGKSDYPSALYSHSVPSYNEY